MEVKNKGIFFSIVVPVYKTEKYLDECIKSVLNQTYKEIELILIDNGSPDNCPIICNNYSKIDQRIIVIHVKKNIGISDARNKGIEASRGKYILFLDSDDYWRRENFLEKIYNELVKSSVDMLIYKGIHFFDQSKKYAPEPIGYKLDYINNIDYYDAIHYLFSTSNFDICAWGRVVKLKIIKDNKIYFGSGLIGEDFDWTLELINYVKSIVAINYPHYVHRMTKTSTAMSNNKSVKACNDFCSIIEKWSSKYKSIRDDDQMKEDIMSYLAYQYYILLGIHININKKERKVVQDSLDSLRWITKYNMNIKAYKCKKIYDLFGFKISSYIFHYYIKYILKR